MTLVTFDAFTKTAGRCSVISIFPAFVVATPVAISWQIFKSGWKHGIFVAKIWELQEEVAMK